MVQRVRRLFSGFIRRNPQVISDCVLYIFPFRPHVYVPHIYALRVTSCYTRVCAAIIIENNDVRNTRPQRGDLLTTLNSELSSRHRRSV